jgi:enoyl-CoA hydratase
MSGRVRVDISERVAQVTLADAKRRNALDVAFAAEIATTFDALEARDDVGAVVVTGEPPAFCAGADLGELESPTPHDLQAIYEGFLRVARSPLPTVAAVNGPAIGAGMNLALVCDLRIAGASARFESRFLRLGLHPGGGHTWLLSRAVGPQAANAMVLFGMTMTSTDADRAGLVWKVVPDEDLLSAAHDVASRAANQDRDLCSRVKTTLAEMTGVDAHADAVTRELDPQLWSFAQPAFRERLAAMRASISARGHG